MISVYISCHDLCSAHRMEDMLNHILIQFGEEQMASEIRSDEGSFRDDVMGIPEIIIYEIKDRRDQIMLSELRDRCPDAQLLLINRSHIPSLKLLEPGINPAVLSEDYPEQGHLMALFREMTVRVYRERERISSRDRLLLRRGDEFFVLRYTGIMYIEAKDKYIVAHYRQGSISFRDTLKSLEGKLPSCFVRCHRGIIVNLLFVYKVHLSMKHIILEDGTIVPLSKSYRHKLKAILTGRLTD